jgi:hypothetical protein
MVDGGFPVSAEVRRCLLKAVADGLQLPHRLTQAGHPHKFRNAARALICAALLAWPRAGWAADCPSPADVIETDRPDTTNSSLVIPYGSLQVENGVNWAVRQGSQVLDGSETRVRLGVAHCGEVLLDVPDYLGALNGLAASGLSDLIVSVKRQLFTERRSFTLSAAAGLGIPVGRSVDGGHFYTPYVQFPWSLAITDDWSLNGMLTVTRLVDHIANKTNVEPTFLVEREFGSKGDLFIEYIEDYSTRNRPSQVIDVGGSWHVTPRQQLDFHIGVGITRTAPDQYIGVGYSFRLDSLFGGAAGAQAQSRSAH